MFPILIISAGGEEGGEESTNPNIASEPIASTLVSPHPSIPLSLTYSRSNQHKEEKKKMQNEKLTTLPTLSSNAAPSTIAFSLASTPTIPN